MSWQLAVAYSRAGFLMKASLVSLDCSVIRKVMPSAYRGVSARVLVWEKNLSYCQLQNPDPTRAWNLN